MALSSDSEIAFCYRGYLLLKTSFFFVQFDLLFTSLLSFLHNIFHNFPTYCNVTPGKLSVYLKKMHVSMVSLSHDQHEIRGVQINILVCLAFWLKVSVFYYDSD